MAVCPVEKRREERRGEERRGEGRGEERGERREERGERREERREEKRRDCGKVVHTHMCLCTDQYNLVLVKGCEAQLLGR